MADPPTKNVRKQVKRNAGAIEVISDRDNPAFERISSNPIVAQVSAFAYMVTGPHLTKYGFYYCLPLRIDSDTVNSGYSTAGVKMKNNDLTIGPLNGGVDTFPVAWSGTTSYSINDLVSSGRQVFKALRDNLNKDPLTEDEDWNEITVEVLNLSEWMGWDSGVQAEPPENTEPDAAIIELLPKLIYLDTIVASNQLATGGDNVRSGFDHIGNTRVFRLMTETSQTNTQQLTAVAYRADGRLSGTGEGLSDVKVIPLSNQDGDFNASSINQFWASDVFESKTEICTWVKGMWYWIPNVQKHIGSSQDVFQEAGGLYPGRRLSDGITTAGTGGKTDIGVNLNNSLGLELDGSEQITVKVDGTSIGFDGSGHLEQIP